jgi:hypothetical protein
MIVARSASKKKKKDFFLRTWSREGSSGRIESSSSSKDLRDKCV